jgi:type I restriction enzyme S subunit
MAELKTKPEIRFAGFADAWEQRKLGEIFQKRSEKNIYLQFGREDILSVAKMRPFESERIDTSSDDYMKTYNVIRLNDIAFEGHTSKDFEYGRFVLNDYGNGIVSHVFDVYEPLEEFDSSFMKEYIHYEPIMKRILVRSTSSARMMNSLKSKEFLQELLYIPLLDEQHKIGEIFANLDHLITLHQREYDKTVNIKKAMLEKMFPKYGADRPEIRFAGFTDAWEQRKLGDVADIVRGASPRPIKDSKWFDDKSDIGWLRISDVTEQDGRIHFLEQRISEAGQEKTRVLTEPHLLLSIAATVGKPVINYVKTGVHDGFLIFQNLKTDREFMFQWLEMFRPKWQKYGQPGSQVNLNSDLVKSKDVLLPNEAEQKDIGEIFASLDRLITLHQRELKKLQNMKKALLEKMFV